MFLGGVSLSFQADFSKIFFFLEWKRALDTFSQVYHRGYLIDFAFQNDWGLPSSQSHATHIKTSLDAVSQKCRTGPIEIALHGIFQRSKSTLKKLAKDLQQKLNRLIQPSEDEVTQALEAYNQQDNPELTSLIGQFQQALQSIPREHFDNLRSQFKAEVNASQKGLSF